MFALQAARHIPSLIEKKGNAVNFAEKILTSRQRITTFSRGQPLNTFLNRRINTLTKETLNQNHKPSENHWKEYIKQQKYRIVAWVSGITSIIVLINSTFKQINEFNNFFNIVNDLRKLHKDFNEKYEFYKLEDKDKDAKAYNLAKQMAEDLENLKEKLKKGSFGQTVEDLIKEVQERNQKNLDKLQKTHEDEVKNLENKNKELQTKVETLTSDHQNLINTRKNEEDDLNRLSIISNLFKHCPQKNEDDKNCARDLNNYLREKTIFKLPQGYKFCPTFMELLEKALHHNLNKEVDEINFYGTYIEKNNGLDHLMEGLKKNTTIKILNLGYTDFARYDHDKDMKNIVNMLKENRTLKELNLSDSYINDQDVDKLIEAINENKTLAKLDLSSTYVKADKKEDLKKLKIDVL